VQELAADLSGSNYGFELTSGFAARLSTPAASSGSVAIRTVHRKKTKPAGVFAIVRALKEIEYALVPASAGLRMKTVTQQCFPPIHVVP